MLADERGRLRLGSPAVGVRVSFIQPGYILCRRCASSGTTYTLCGTGLVANKAHAEIWSHGHIGQDRTPNVLLHSRRLTMVDFGRPARIEIEGAWSQSPEC